MNTDWHEFAVHCGNGTHTGPARTAPRARGGRADHHGGEHHRAKAPAPGAADPGHFSCSERGGGGGGGENGPQDQASRDVIGRRSSAPRLHAPRRPTHLPPFKRAGLVGAFSPRTRTMSSIGGWEPPASRSFPLRAPVSAGRSERARRGGRDSEYNYVLCDVVDVPRGSLRGVICSGESVTRFRRFSLARGRQREVEGARRGAVTEHSEVDLE